MPIERAPLDRHVTWVETLEQADVTPPAEWSAVRQRFEDFHRMTTPAQERLITAILDGDGDVPALRAASYAEMSVQPAVHSGVANAVLERLRDLYRPSARKNYGKIASQFDKAAAEFTAAAGIVDPEADAETIVTASEDQRVAWAEIPVLAVKLDGLLAPLKAAAELCGVSVKQREAQHGLTVDASGVHRRRAWEAFDHKGGRGGRWSAIVKVGGTIRAASLDDFSPYRGPRPLEEKTENRGGFVVTTMVDPEDPQARTA